MTYPRDPHWMTAKFASACSACKAVIRKGERIFYYPNGKRALGESCGCAARAAADFEAARADEQMMGG